MSLQIKLDDTELAQLNEAAAKMRSTPEEVARFAVQLWHQLDAEGKINYASFPPTN